MVIKKHLDDRELPVSQGRVLGGSSAINGLVYTPPTKETIDAWVKLGNKGWEWDSFRKSLEKSHRLTSSVDGSTSGNGPLQVWVPDIANNPWSKVWSGTLDNLGFKPVDDTSSDWSVGTIVNADTVNPATGQRSYAVSAYFEPARQRENITVITGASVQKILFDTTSTATEPTAIGVEYDTGDGTTVAYASKEVILAAGTLNSPRLLELSGVGARAKLEKLGVDVVVENPFVGENLQCHSMCAVSFESDEDALKKPSSNREALSTVTNGDMPKYLGTGLNAAAYLPFPGIDTPAGVSDLEDILRKYSREQENSEANAEPSIATANKLFEDMHAEFVHSLLRAKDGVSGYYVSSPCYVPVSGPPSPGSETYFSILLLLPHPLSRGSVHVTSASPLERNLAINPRFLSHPLDIELFARHLCQTEKIVATQPLADCIKLGGKRNPAASRIGAFTDLETAKTYLRQTSVGAHHYTGTCSMMAKEYGGVVDEKLRVYGCRNLRVCDASIFPITPPVNPQATVYAVAEHGASIIKADL